MSHFLNIRHGPKMEFIVEEQRREFEQHVIDIYCEEEPTIYGQITSLDVDILPNLNRMYMLTGITENPTEFIKETKENMIPEFAKYWSQAELERIGLISPDHANFAIMGAAKDALSVLDFHKMSLGVRIRDDETGGTGMHGFMHMPIPDVW